VREIAQRIRQVDLTRAGDAAAGVASGRLAAGDFEGGKSGAVGVLTHLGFTVKEKA
jgi:hypothetical protein